MHLDHALSKDSVLRGRSTNSQQFEKAAPVGVIPHNGAGYAGDLFGPATNAAVPAMLDHPTPPQKPEPHPPTTRFSMDAEAPSGTLFATGSLAEWREQRDQFTQPISRFVRGAVPQPPHQETKPVSLFEETESLLYRKHFHGEMYAIPFEQAFESMTETDGNVLHQYNKIGGWQRGTWMGLFPPYKTVVKIIGKRDYHNAENLHAQSIVRDLEPIVGDLSNVIILLDGDDEIPNSVVGLLQALKDRIYSITVVNDGPAVSGAFKASWDQSGTTDKVQLVVVSPSDGKKSVLTTKFADFIIDVCNEKHPYKPHLHPHQFGQVEKTIEFKEWDGIKNAPSVPVPVVLEKDSGISIVDVRNTPRY